MYSHCAADEAGMNPTLPPGFLEETCSLLHLDPSIHPLIDSLKAESLRTLTAIISNDKPARFARMFDATAGRPPGLVRGALEKRRERDRESKRGRQSQAEREIDR